MTTIKYAYRPGKELPDGLTRWVLNIVASCKGRDKAITRERINEILLRYHNMEISERTLRRVMEEIRRMGIRLCDLEDGSGLFIAKTQAEYDAFKLRYASHAWSLIKTVRAMDEEVSVDELLDKPMEEITVQPVQMRFGL